MAAGLGFKTFTSGEVLTAADTNGYLMQGINVFANASARTAAITSPQEGQYSYLKDTNALEYYDGAAWVGAPVGDITAVTAGKGLTGGGSSGDVTVSLATTAKGDLVAGSGASTAAVLTVGANGETLVADSTASTGLRYQGNFAAGKNKVINGDFGVWQRGTSISLTTAAVFYNADRFYVYSDFSAGSSSVSRQTFTPGTAPVAGYEGQYFARYTAGSTTTYFEYGQKIENVQTLAGQTATFSFWAKASANTTLSLSIAQNFGSGGSTQVTTSVGTNALTTSWQRFTATFAVPSISGKTVGTSSYLTPVLIGTSITGSQTIDFWGWQLEAGSVATAFQTATGTIQGELAACQRYYQRFGAKNGQTVGTNATYGTGFTTSSTGVNITVPFPVTMRTTPTSIEYANITSYDATLSQLTPSAVALVSGQSGLDAGNVQFTVTGSVGGRAAVIIQNATTGYLAFSAEL